MRCALFILARQIGIVAVAAFLLLDAKSMMFHAVLARIRAVVIINTAWRVACPAASCTLTQGSASSLSRVP
jgi:hypothetical protein